MEQKRRPRIDVFLVRFWNGSGNIDGTAGGPRVSREWAASRPRRVHFLQRIPQGGPRARGVIKQKQAKTGVVGGSNTPRAVGSANSFVPSFVR